MTEIRRDFRAFRDSKFDFDYVKTLIKNIAKNFVFDRIEFNNIYFYNSFEKLMNDLNFYYNDDNKKIIVMLKFKNFNFEQKYNENFTNFVVRLNEIINSIEFIDIQKIYYFRELMLFRFRINIVAFIDIKNYRLYIKNCIEIVNNFMQIDFKNKHQSTYKSKKKIHSFR